MDKFQQQLMKDLEQRALDWNSIFEAKRTLWSEASDQLRAEAERRRIADKERGTSFNNLEQAYAVSNADIFIRYKALVQKYMVDSREPREHD